MPATSELQQGLFVVQNELNKIGELHSYCAVDTTLGTEVLMIEFPEGSSGSWANGESPAFERFLQRADVLSRFRHPSVIPVLGCFSEDGQTYVVTELSQGTDLSSLIEQRQQPFPVYTVADWADSLLDALSRLHTFRPPQIHGCVKPPSIELRPNGSVALSMASSFTENGIDIAGDKAGTGRSALPFSALEQLWPGLDAASQKVIVTKLDEGSGKILRQDLDARTDIYSLGATIYWLITGNTPIDALERAIEVMEGNHDPLPSPNSIDPKIPREISDVVMKSLEIRREFRFDSAAIMRQVLRSARLRANEREASNETLSSIAVGPAQDRPEAPSHTQTRPPISSASVSAQLTEMGDDLLGIMSPAPPTGHRPPEPSLARTNSFDPDESAPLPDIGSLYRANGNRSDEVRKPDGFLSPGPDVPDDAGNDAGHPAVVEPTNSNALSSVTIDDEAMVPPIDAFGLADSTLAEVSHDGSESVEEPVKRSGLLAVAATAAILIVLAGAGWVLLGPANASPVEPNPVRPEQPLMNQVPNEDSTVRQSSSAPQPVELPATSDETNGDVAEPKTRRSESPVTSSALPKPKRQVASTSPTPSPKRSVTVDDLINDN